MTVTLTQRALNAQAVAAVRVQLKEAGIHVTPPPKTAGPGIAANEKYIHIKTPNGARELVLYPMVGVSYGYGQRDEAKMTGWTIRFGYGRGTMGTQRYPLRKDGTIDVARLKQDLASYDAMMDRRHSAESEKVANVRALADAFANVKAMATQLNGAAGAGVFIDVENDGSAAGRIRFKVSGHVSPARVLAIFAAIAATNAQEPT